MELDLWSLYRQMLFSRRFEDLVSDFWHAGLISGEMHLSTGEEGIAAGVLAHIREGDALALDHRGTAPLLMRGVDATLVLRELLGLSDGLCAGWGGHMHLFSRPHLAACSGIVGASAPAAVGFALSATYLRPEALAVAFFGEGATNEGQVMESLNLAAAWKLPVIFVCKDNGQAIATPSQEVTGGTVMRRAEGFGMAAVTVDGSDVKAVWHAAAEAVARARQQGGPTFFHATCIHLEGHFLGDPLLRAGRSPLREMPSLALSMIASALQRRSAPWRVKMRSLLEISKLVSHTRRESLASARDPLVRTRAALDADADRLARLEAEVALEIRQVRAAAAAEPPGTGNRGA